MAVSLTDLIEDLQEVVDVADEEGERYPEALLTLEEWGLILAALKRFEKCDGKHG